MENDGWGSPASSGGDPLTAETSLTAQVKTGLRWAAMRQIVTGLVGTLGAVAYTRFLRPEDLGAFGLASLVYGGLFLLIQAPIRDAVVYYRDQDDSHSSAAFWLLSCFSVTAVILVMIFAGAFGRFYRSPQATGLTRGMAIVFLFQAVAVVPAALLLRRFRFAAHEGLQTISELILLVGWVILSALGFGPWSLVIPYLIASIFWAVTTWVAAGFRPVFHFGRSAYHDVINFSRNLFGSKLITYLSRNLDNAAVGTLGERALGWYNFGESQAEYYGIVVGTTIAQIALPAMAAARSQVEKLRQIYLDLLRLAATLSIPMQIGSMLLADLGITIFLGERWLGAVPIFRAYLVLWLLRTLLEINDSLTSATGHPGIRFAVDLAQLPFFAAGTWFGLRVWGGIGGVALSLVIVRLIAGAVYFAATMRLTRLSVGDVRRYLGPSVVAGGLMGLVVYAVRRAGVITILASGREPSLQGDILNLAVLTIVGIVSYFALLYALDPPGFKAVAIMTWQILFTPGVPQKV